MKKIFILIYCMLLSNLIEAKTYSKASSFRAPLKSEEITSFKKKNIQEKAPKTISLLVWNIFTGHKKKWEDTYRNLSQQYNLVMLQEFYLKEQMKKVFKEDQFEYFLGTAYVFKKENITSGVATGSTFKTFGHSTLYTKDFEPIMNVKKTSLISYATLASGKKLLMANVHAINFVTDNVFISQINGLIGILKNHSGPIIFAGDFNTFTYGKLKYLKHEIEKIGLKEVSFTNDIRKHFLKFPLDHCFYRGLNVKEARVLNTNEGSDHNALHIIFDY